MHQLIQIGIHISFDLDVIDPIISPGVSVPVENGINLEETYEFVNYIKKNKNLIKSLDIVEFNPLKDINSQTLNIASKIIKELVETFKN